MSPLSPIQATFTADESCQVLAALHTAHGWDELVLTVPGEFQVVNQHLLKDLTELGIWGEEMKHKLIAHHGSVQVRVHCPSLWPHLFPFPSPLQNIKEIPAELKPLYKTVWEMSQRALIDMCADRGAFIDQSQSFNVHIPDPNFGKLTSMHFYAWKKV